MDSRDQSTKLLYYLPACTPFALRAGPRACLQALRTRVLARVHGVLARERTSVPGQKFSRVLSHGLPSILLGMADQK